MDGYSGFSEFTSAGEYTEFWVAGFSGDETRKFFTLTLYWIFIIVGNIYKLLVYAHAHARLNIHTHCSYTFE